MFFPFKTDTDSIQKLPLMSCFSCHTGSLAPFISVCVLVCLSLWWQVSWGGIDFRFSLLLPAFLCITWLTESFLIGRGVQQGCQSAKMTTRHLGKGWERGGVQMFETASWRTPVAYGILWALIIHTGTHTQWFYYLYVALSFYQDIGNPNLPNKTVGPLNVKHRIMNIQM